MNRDALQNLLSSIGASIKETPPLYYEERIGELNQSEVIFTSILSLYFEAIIQEPESYSAEVEIGLYYSRILQEEKIIETRRTRIERIKLMPSPRAEVRNQILNIVKGEVKRRIDEIFDRLMALIAPRGEV